MGKYGKLIIGIIVLCIFIGGSVFAYQKLSAQYKVEPELIDQSGKQEEAAEPDETESPEAQPETGQNQPEDEGAGGDSEEKGTKLIDFTVKNGEMEDVTLSSFVGKPIVLNFWASWCSPCKSEMPEFQKLYEELGEEVEFVIVNLTDGKRETVETASAFLEKEGYSFPVYYDTEQEAAYAYYVNSIPTTYFIDKDGYIITYAQGALEENTLRKGIGMIFEE